MFTLVYCSACQMEMGHTSSKCALQALCADDILKRASNVQSRTRESWLLCNARMLCSAQEVEEQSLTAAKGCNNSCFASMLLMCLGSCMRHSRTNVAALSVSLAASKVLPAQSVSRAAKRNSHVTHTQYMRDTSIQSPSIESLTTEDCQNKHSMLKPTLYCDLAKSAIRQKKVLVSQKCSCTER